MIRLKVVKMKDKKQNIDNSKLVGVYPIWNKLSEEEKVFFVEKIFKEKEQKNTGKKQEKRK